MEITQKLLKTLVSYDRDTGEFTWLDRAESSGKNYKTFNSRFSGLTINNIDIRGYNRIGINCYSIRKNFLAHRLAWIYVHGCEPNNIDHVNGNKLDNRICNLRDTTHRENLKNQRLNKNNTSGVCGVWKSKSSGTWYAQICSDGKKTHLGAFKTKDLATLARLKANKEHGFHENHGSPKSI